ncbi:MAG: response regulator transcription factor [Hydrogenibacillus sp.]|nr:response regulator transcription factor [Hydrogenibacillus sp.]
MYALYLVEDDAQLAALMAEALARYGFRVHQAAGDDFWRLAEAVDEVKPHLILLDINLPAYDGFYWARRIRAVTKAPMLFISARGEPIDQVRALENGGDDYIVKPFHMDVLVAKVYALLRRAYGELADARDRLPTYAGLVADMTEQALVYGERRVFLSPTEMRLMRKLIEAKGKPVSREELLIAAWDEASFVDDNTLTVNITRLRQKLKALGLEEAIVTVRGVGYRLEV